MSKGQVWDITKSHFILHVPHIGNFGLPAIAKISESAQQTLSFNMFSQRSVGYSYDQNHILSQI